MGFVVADLLIDITSVRLCRDENENERGIEREGRREGMRRRIGKSGFLWLPALCWRGGNNYTRHTEKDL